MSQHPDPSAGADTRVDQLLSLSAQLVRGGVLVVIATGEVDMVTTPHLRAYLDQHLVQATSMLVIDLRGVRFLGSSGLAVLVEIMNRTKEREITLRLVGNSREVLRPLEATGLTKLFEIHSTLESALPPA